MHFTQLTSKNHLSVFFFTITLKRCTSPAHKPASLIFISAKQFPTPDPLPRPSPPLFPRARSAVIAAFQHSVPMRISSVSIENKCTHPRHAATIDCTSTLTVAGHALHYTIPSIHIGPSASGGAAIHSSHSSQCQRKRTSMSTNAPKCAPLF